jgi:hypothetical protein
VSKVKVWCECCDGTGEVDGTLGGLPQYSRCDEKCPDCDGEGWIGVPREALAQPEQRGEVAAWYDGNKFYANTESASMCCADMSKLRPVYYAPPAPSAPDGWMRAIDEAMVVHHVGVADPADDYETARNKLNRLLCVLQDIGALHAGCSCGCRGEFRAEKPKLAYYQTHEPPHCPTCGCGMTAPPASAVPDERKVESWMSDKTAYEIHGWNLCRAAMLAAAAPTVAAKGVQP